MRLHGGKLFAGLGSIMRVFNVREGSDRYIVTADPGCSCFRLFPRR